MKAITLFSLLLISNLFSNSQHWNKIYPKYTNSTINVSEKVGSDKIVIGGEDGTILLHIDQQQDWLKVIYNNDENSSIVDLSFVDYNLGFALTKEGKLFRTMDGGYNWGEVADLNFQDCKSTYFITSEKGFICCGDGTLFKTIDGGVNWSQESLISEYSLNDIEFSSDNSVGYIVGGTNDLVRFVNGSLNSDTEAEGVILKTLDYGDTWEEVLNQTYHYLNCVAFSDQDDVVFGGGYNRNDYDGMNSYTQSSGYILTSADQCLTLNSFNHESRIFSIDYDGSMLFGVGQFYDSWFSYISTGLGGFDLRTFGFSGVFDNPFLVEGEFREEINCVVSQNMDKYCFGRDGLIALFPTYKEKTNEWNLEKNMIASGNIAAIDIVDGKKFCMISSPYFDDGKFDLYTESADHWYRVNNQSFTDSNYQFNGSIAFDFITTDTGYALVGDMNSWSASDLYKTMDGGFSWEKISQLGGEPGEIKFLDLDRGLYYDKSFKILEKTIDGGVNWSYLVEDIDFNSYSIDTDRIYIIKDGYLQFTDNFGESWNPIFATSSDTKVKFNGDIGVLINSNSCKVTTNGGSGWLGYTHPFLNEHINSIHISDCGVILVVYDENKIYKSTNFGESWSLAYTSSRNINDLTFTEDGAIAVCDNGVVAAVGDLDAENLTLSEALKYYPLNSGDVRRYCITNNQEITRVETIVGEDTILGNGKTYKQVGDFFERVEQSTGNLYRFNQSSNSEDLLDSLLATPGDKYESVRYPQFYDDDEQSAQCIEFIDNIQFGTLLPTKVIRRSIEPTGDNYLDYRLTKDLGFTFFTHYQYQSIPFMEK